MDLRGKGLDLAAHALDWMLLLAAARETAWFLSHGWVVGAAVMAQPDSPGCSPYWSAAIALANLWD